MPAQREQLAVSGRELGLGLGELAAQLGQPGRQGGDHAGGVVAGFTRRVSGGCGLVSPAAPAPVARHPLGRMDPPPPGPLTMVPQTRQTRPPPRIRPGQTVKCDCRTKQCPDPLLADDGTLPPQRVRLPAERGQQVLRQGSGLVADLPEVPRPGQHAHHRDGQHEPPPRFGRRSLT